MPFPADSFSRLRTTSRAALALFFAACASAPRQRIVNGPPPPTSVPGLRHAIDSMVADPKFRSAQFGILVVDPERGDTLYSRNAGKLFVPASNQKILTGSVALAQLGAEHRFTTTFVATGSIAEGTLRGDLVVNGTGDPSISDAMRSGDAMAPLRAIADSLNARGIRHIAGALRTGTDAFPGPTLGYGWEWDDLDYAYSAAVDELFFNEGIVRVTVRGGANVGDAPTVTTAPARTVPRVRIAAATSAGGAPRALVLANDSLSQGNLVLSGSIAAGDSAMMTRAIRDPSTAYLTALREALEAKGIAVDRGIIATHAAPSSPAATTAGSGGPQAIEPSGTPLFSLVSPPLRDILRAFEKPSQNQIGEILLRALGRERTGVGTPDSGLRVIRTQLTEWGAQSDGFVSRDGSGLSQHDVVSPETLVHALDGVRRHPSFAAFYDALPIAGVDGTIRNRMRGTPAERNVHAKTGSVDMARSLSGYVTTASGRMLIFSVLANRFVTPASEVEHVADVIAARLAALQTVP